MAPIWIAVVGKFISAAEIVHPVVIETRGLCFW